MAKSMRTEAPAETQFHMLIGLMTVALVVGGAAITVMQSYEISLIKAQLSDVQLGIAQIRTMPEKSAEAAPAPAAGTMLEGTVPEGTVMPDDTVVPADAAMKQGSTGKTK